MKNVLKKIGMIFCSTLISTNAFSQVDLRKIEIKNNISENNKQLDLNLIETNTAKDKFLSDFVTRCWSTEDGLVGNTITSLMQDSIGYLYIGTYDGLVRFDGVDFVTLNRNTDPKYDFISTRSIFQDSKENIWVGSNDEGITCIKKDGSTLSFSMKSGLPNNSIRSICEDKEGHIWIGTAAGLAYFSYDEKMDNYNITRPKGLEEFGGDNILVEKLYCDTAGRIWITTGKTNGTFIYTNKSFEIFNGIKKLEDPKIDSITQDYSGTFWFGVEPHYLVRVSDNDEEIYDIGHGKQKGTYINKIYQDKNANIWIALDAGVSVIHNGKISYFDDTNGLIDEKVSDIIEDREGNMWFATDRGGIEKLSLSKFKTTPMQTSINAICEDENRGLTWIAGDDGLYCVKDGNFIESNLTELCKNIRIRHVGVTKTGNLLISTYEKLGQLLVTPDNKVRAWDKKSGLTGNKTRVAIETSDRSILIGTTTGLNIIEYDTDKKEYKDKIISITKENSLSNDYIMCIFEASDGLIWCGTDGGGIFSLQKSNGIYNIKDVITTNDGLSGNVIFKINEINGKLWICTGRGLSRIKEVNGKKEIFNFNSSNGLGTSGVFQAISDYTGTIWMTSNRGVFNVKLEELENCAEGNIKRVSSRYFGKSEGLISRGVTSTSLSTKDKLGRIWFTLIDGFAVYDPVKITTNKTAPVVQIQEYSIDNEKYVWDGKTIILQPNVKRFGIKYTGISFITSEQMQFSSKLEGFDKLYSDWSTSRTVSYTNLKHGTYKFSVMTKNGDENKSNPSDFITIIKKPYLWELTSFWIVVLLLVIGNATFLVFLRLRNLKNRNILLEKKVEERTHELKLEKERSESLLLNILPKDIAEELSKEQNKTISKKYPNVTVLFTDIVGFTKMSDGLSAEVVVKMLNSLFSRFDIRAKEEGIEKIKTIGDSYMAACGLTEEKDNKGAEKMLHYARGILKDLEEFNKKSEIQISLRIGINTGNLVAGVIGKTKFIYDIWGDTVNTASRMESSGKPLEIHVSETTYEATKDAFLYKEPVEVEVKGKGLMKTYYLV